MQETTIQHLTTRRARTNTVPLALSLLGLVVACGPFGCAARTDTRASGSGWSSRDQSVMASTSGPQPLTVMRTSSPRDAALTLLLQACDSQSALLRANAIEALNAVPSEARMPIQRGLGDGNRGVRFVAAMSVGLMGLGDLAPLLEPLRRDEHASVQAAAIFGLRRNGHLVDPTPLAAMIRSDDPEVRGNAALVLGELGDPSAIPMIQAALGRGMRMSNPAMVRIVELQMAEAQVRLGDSSAIEPIRAAMFAPPEQAELVVLATQVVGRLGDRTSVAFLRQLVFADGLDRRPPEIRLAATAALGRMGEATPDLLAVVAESIADPNPALRAQAAATLGHLRDRRGLDIAAQGLNDRDPLVQIAAAGAVLRLAD